MHILSNVEFEKLVTDLPPRMRVIAKERCDKSPCGFITLSELAEYAKMLEYSGDPRTAKWLKNLAVLAKNGKIAKLRSGNETWEDHVELVAALHTAEEIPFGIGQHIFITEEDRYGSVVDYIPATKEYLVVLNPFQVKQYKKDDLKKVARVVTAQEAYSAPATESPAGQAPDFSTPDAAARAYSQFNGDLKSMHDQLMQDWASASGLELKPSEIYHNYRDVYDGNYSYVRSYWDTQQGNSPEQAQSSPQSAPAQAQSSPQSTTQPSAPGEQSTTWASRRLVSGIAATLNTLATIERAASEKTAQLTPPPTPGQRTGLLPSDGVHGFIAVDKYNSSILGCGDTHEVAYSEAIDRGEALAKLEGAEFSADDIEIHPASDGLLDALFNDSPDADGYHIEWTITKTSQVPELAVHPSELNPNY